MKSILENWRGYIAEQKEINTVGDLRKAIKLMRLKDAGGEVGKRAASALVGMLPGGGTALTLFTSAKDSLDLLKKVYGADDKAKTGTGLDKLNVNDQVSAIVDDPIEVAFLNYLIKDKFVNAPEDQSLEDFDATKGLQRYLIDKFGGTTVKK